MQRAGSNDVSVIGVVFPRKSICTTQTISIEMAAVNGRPDSESGSGYSSQCTSHSADELIEHLIEKRTLECLADYHNTSLLRPIAPSRQALRPMDHVLHGVKHYWPVLPLDRENGLEPKKIRPAAVDGTA